MLMSAWPGRASMQRLLSQHERPESFEIVRSFSAREALAGGVCG
jgi:hypothetical protein